jgi:hypothetical protein
LEGARALSVSNGVLLAICLICARGRPQRLKRKRKRVVVHENGVGMIVGDGLVPFFADCEQ